MIHWKLPLVISWSQAFNRAKLMNFDIWEVHNSIYEEDFAMVSDGVERQYWRDSEWERRLEIAEFGYED